MSSEQDMQHDRQEGREQQPEEADGGTPEMDAVFAPIADNSRDGSDAELSSDSDSGHANNAADTEDDDADRDLMRGERAHSASPSSASTASDLAYELLEAFLASARSSTAATSTETSAAASRHAESPPPVTAARDRSSPRDNRDGAAHNQHQHQQPDGDLVSAGVHAQMAAADRRERLNDVAAMAQQVCLSVSVCV